MIATKTISLACRPELPLFNPDPIKVNAYHAVVCFFIDALSQYYIYDSIGRTFKILAADYKLTGVKSFRDLPQNWKELNMTDKGFTKSHDGRTFIFYRKIATPEEFKALGSLFDIPVPLNPDGTVNFPEAEKQLNSIDQL